jgi:hypothetical protein
MTKITPSLFFVAALLGATAPLFAEEVKTDIAATEEVAPTEEIKQEEPTEGQAK